MMIAHDVARTELNRLNGLAFRPTDESARREVVIALATVSDSYQHCLRIIEQLLRTSTEYPKPKEIYDLGEEIRDKEISASVPQGCQLCHNTGYESKVKVRDTPEGPRLYGYVEHCSCAKGRWLDAKWKERKERGE